jgi:SAM-dependent methyltransferase
MESAVPHQSGHDEGRSARTHRQREYWSGRYAEDPNLFGESESALAHWGLKAVGNVPPGGTLIELGCGNGRDLRYFQSLGYQVRGVDCAGDVPFRQLPHLQPLDIQCRDALEFLQQQGSSSVDVVYSNLFYNMDFTEEDHRELFREAARVLRPGGFHLYSVRTVKDRWYGRGRKVGEDTYDSTPDGTTMHFFSSEYARRLRPDELTLVQEEEFEKGKGDFPIQVLYIAERKRAGP